MNNDKYSTIEKLRKKASSVTIHKRNFRFLAIEMFNAIKDISPLEEMNYLTLMKQ